MTYRQRVNGITARYAGHVDAIVDGYRNQLQLVVSSAQTEVVSYLATNLVFDANGKLKQTAGNQKILRGLDAKFMSVMDKVGYKQLNEAFVTSFDGQLPYFQEILDALSQNMKEPLPALNWDQRSLNTFSSLRANNVQQLNSVVELASTRAVQRALFSVAGMPLKDLVRMISSEYARSVGEAEGIGATAMSSYYRAITALGYDMIQADLPEMELRFFLEGPLDALTRPWCSRRVGQSRSGATWTREQIAAMVNDGDRGKSQPPNVMICAGGWNCRHQFCLSIPKDI